MLDEENVEKEEEEGRREGREDTVPEGEGEMTLLY